MSYVIFGRAIKNEHLSLAVIFSAIGIATLATSGGKKAEASKPGSALERVRESIPINAGSSEEERFIKKYIAEAEKESGGH